MLNNELMLRSASLQVQHKLESDYKLIWNDLDQFTAGARAISSHHDLQGLIYVLYDKICREDILHHAYRLARSPLAKRSFIDDIAFGMRRFVQPAAVDRD